jgi:hypothetical protein
VHKSFLDFTRYTRQIAARTLNLAISKRLLFGACVLLAAVPALCAGRWFSPGEFRAGSADGIHFDYRARPFAGC